MLKHLIDPGAITRETLNLIDETPRAKPVERLPLGEETVKRADPDRPKEGPHSDEESRPERPAPRDRDPRQGVALAEVPEHFFDRRQWDDFVAGGGSREVALDRISSREAGIFVFYRQQAAEQPTEAGARAREAERVSRLGQRIVAGFLARLTGGEFVATGLQPPSIDRVVIPAELWSQLTPNFAKGKAKGGGYVFVQICVIEAAHRAPPEAEIVERIAAWLSQRRHHGDESKRILLGAARDAFGDECKTRAFDAAYRRVYCRNRGQPPRPAGR